MAKIITQRSHRPATLADLSRIVDIYNSTIPSRQVTGDLEPIPTDSRLHWLQSHQSATRPLWVAEANAQVVAWISFSDFYGRPAYCKTAELSLYVDESVRRCGWGAYLLTQAIAHAPALQVSRLLAFIFGHNEPSLKLFQKFGFEQWGYLPGVATLDQCDRDLVILGRAVKP
jgi:L-amino acid N-acyltransferase YncA